MKDTTHKNWKLCIKIYKTIFSIIQYCLLKASLYPSKIWQWVGDPSGGLFFNLKHRLFLGFYNDSLYPFALSIAIFWICSPLFVTSLCVISTNCCKAALPKNRNKEFAKDYQQHNVNNILSNSRHRLFYMLLPLFVDCSNTNAVSVVLKESPSFWRALNISNLWKLAVSSVKLPIFKSRST